MKSFYKLSRKEFKEVKNEFISDYVGMKLNLITNVAFAMAGLFLLFTLVQGFLVTLMGGTVPQENLNLDFIIIILSFMCGLITYPFYFYHLKKFYDEKKKKK
ncbi:MAG: hypothetical protein IJH18_01450 [Bacilli bacterium]|nr:hypothetical protein [Bacilli bacterium]